MFRPCSNRHCTRPTTRAGLCEGCRSVLIPAFWFGAFGGFALGFLVMAVTQ